MTTTLTSDLSTVTGGLPAAPLAAAAGDAAQQPDFRRDPHSREDK
jgi:hypothetical protein